MMVIGHYDWISANNIFISSAAATTGLKLPQIVNSCNARAVDWGRLGPYARQIFDPL